MRTHTFTAITKIGIIGLALLGLCQCNSRGSNSLIDAARTGQLLTIERLLIEGSHTASTDDEQRTALQVAADAGQAEVVAFFLERGDSDIDHQDGEGWTSLMCAAVHGHQDVVGLLVSHGAQLDRQNRYGNTALMWAAQTNQRVTVAYLLGAGANPHLFNQLGWTATTIATKAGHPELASLLESQTATIPPQNRLGAQVP